MEPGPLDALAAAMARGRPAICVPAKRDEFRLLTRTGSSPLPIPPQLHNHGNFIISLGLLTPWLAQKAEGLGRGRFPGLRRLPSRCSTPTNPSPACASATWGCSRMASPDPTTLPGAEIRARTTVIAEGARGSLAKQLIRRFGLDARSCPQTLRTWHEGAVAAAGWPRRAGTHSTQLGWPLDSRTYGGSFIYHLDNDRAYVGFVVGLDYEDPRLSPFEAFQQFKHHPSVKPLLEGGEILAAGARTIAAGGWQSIPRLDMPGAMLIGDTRRAA